MNGRNLDLRLLRVFDALISEGNVTRAGIRLHLTQSAISQALAKLREEARDPLFIRVGGAMRPTAKALAMSEPIKEALSMVTQAFEVAAGFDPASAVQSFRIATTDHTLMLLLPRLAKHIGQLAPGIHLAALTMGHEQGFAQMRDGHVDMLIANFAVTRIPDSFHLSPLFSDKFIVIARHGHPRLHAGMTTADYAREEHIVVAPRGLWDPGPIDRVLEREGLTRNIRIMVPHYSVVPLVVADTDLIATVPASVTLGSLSGVQSFRPPQALPNFKVEMVWDERHHHDPGHRWLRTLISELGKGMIQEVAVIN
jgi:DNA-binding transcriptional LysR family regulator